MEHEYNPAKNGWNRDWETDNVPDEQEKEMSILDREWAASIRQHAKENYDRDGWDYIVECWEDSDIVKAWGDAKDLKQALANVHEVVQVMDSRRKDVESEIF